MLQYINTKRYKFDRREIMIYTSSHKYFKKDNYRTYSISSNHDNYQEKHYSLLEPNQEFVNIYNSNIGKIPEEENIKYYIQEYWNQVLSKLDPQEIYKELDNYVILSDESNTEFGPRHIMAAWLEILLDVNIQEIKNNGYKINKLERPKYIKEYLEEAMKNNRNMRGFSSLRALYLFEKAEKLENKADELEETTEYYYNNIRQTASFLRCDADMEEERYRKLSKKRLLRP